MKASTRRNIAKYRHRYYLAHKEERKKYNRRYYLQNKRKMNAQAAEWYRKNRRKALAYARRYVRENHATVLRKGRDYYKRNWRQRCAAAHAWKRSMKDRVKVFLGGMCACCGEREMEFLTIDHIRGGGARTRNKCGFRRNEVYYHEVNRARQSVDSARKIRKKYQVLCFNCNWSKHYGGACAHKRKAGRFKKVEE